MTIIKKYFIEGESPTSAVSQEKAESDGDYKVVITNQETEESFSEHYLENEIYMVSYDVASEEGLDKVLHLHNERYHSTTCKVELPINASKTVAFIFDEGTKPFRRNELEHDDQGKIIKEVYFNTDGSLDLTMENAYDENGFLAEAKEFDGEGELQSHVKYENDNQGNTLRIIELFEGGGEFITDLD